MCETDLVLDLLRELSSRDCNGHARVKLGAARADPDRFQRIFYRYAQGTYFEEVDLDLDVVRPEVACSCGYRARPRNGESLRRCPRCQGRPHLAKGDEFRIVEPAPN